MKSYSLWPVPSFKHISLLIAVLLSMLSQGALAAACAATMLDQYLVSGFSCTVGNLDLSNFGFRTNLVASNSTSMANLPSAIQVVPQALSGQAGLGFTNLGDFFSGNFSNVNTQIYFTATAVSGMITGDTVNMTGYSASGSNGEATASMYDGGGALPTASVGCFNCSSPPSLTNSQTFAGITSTPIYASVAAVNTGFGGGSASVDGVTALFTLSQVPVPGAVWLFGSGLIGLIGATKKRKIK